jgi:hypothetical protein
VDLYSRDNDAEARQVKVLTMDEGKRIAINIARLPELLGKRDGWITANSCDVHESPVQGSTVRVLKCLVDRHFHPRLPLLRRGLFLERDGSPSTSRGCQSCSERASAD